MAYRLETSENRLRLVHPLGGSRVLGLPLPNYECVLFAGIKGAGNGVGGGDRAYFIDMRSSPSINIGVDGYTGGSALPRHEIKVFPDRIEAHGVLKPYTSIFLPKHQTYEYQIDKKTGNAILLLTLEPETVAGRTFHRTLRILIQKPDQATSINRYY
jgi:hypothetical protein